MSTSGKQSNVVCRQPLPNATTIEYLKKVWVTLPVYLFQIDIHEVCGFPRAAVESPLVALDPSLYVVISIVGTESLRFIVCFADVEAAVRAEV
jgi:hypothetical protein